MKPEENPVLLSDIKNLFYRHLKWVILAIFVCGGAGFWIRSQKPIQHEIHATFRDGEKSVGETKGALETVLKVMEMAPGNHEGHILFTSSAVLGPVVEKLGLQAQVQERSRLKKVVRQFSYATRAEKGQKIPENDHFIFSDVHFREEFPKTYALIFQTKDRFEVQNKKGKTVAIGEVGKKVAFHNLSFVLLKVPKKLALDTLYPLSLSPLQETMLGVQKKLDILPNKKHPGFVHLQFTHPIRSQGLQFVDALMSEYQSYLQRESKELSSKQMAYLEKKRDEMCEKMGTYLQTHVDYMKHNLSEKGSFTLSQHVPLFQERRLKFTGNLQELELKRKRLFEASPWSPLPMGGDVASLQENLFSLAKEKDELRLASSPHDQAVKFVKQLDRVDEKRVGTQHGVDRFFSSLFPFSKEKESLILHQIPLDLHSSAEQCSLKRVQEEKKALANELRKGGGDSLSREWVRQNYRLANLKEEIIKNRILSGVAVEKEYQGIDLKTARTLFINAINKRDEILAEIRQMESGKRAFEKECVEYISLVAAFPDSVSQTLIKEIGELHQQLHQERHFTEKEKERTEKKLLQKKEDLGRHMKEAIALSAQKKEGMDERITSIQQAMIDLLGQEIALIEKQIEDRIEKELNYLDQEEKLIEHQLAEIKKELSEVPDLWLKERELQFSADMQQSILESLVRLVEAKNIENDAAILKAKPINEASTKIAPKKPLLFIFGGVGGFIGGLIAAFFLMVHGISLRSPKA